MFAYFFSFETEIPYGLGFRLFGPEHLCWLISIGFFLMLFSLYFFRQNKARRKKILDFTVLLALCLTITQDVILIAIGHMNVRMLPLHLCDLATFVFLLQRLTHARFLSGISVCLLMPGALCALLFPEWTHYPFFNFMHIHGFFYHMLVVLFPLLLLVDKQVQPRLFHIWQPLAFLFCIVPPIYLFDRSFRSNYLFLRYAPAGSPIKQLENEMGNPGYLLGYAILVFLALLLLYGVFEIYYRFSSKQKTRRT